jgi:hypothetical protein
LSDISSARGKGTVADGLFPVHQVTPLREMGLNGRPRISRVELGLRIRTRPVRR